MSNPKLDSKKKKLLSVAAEIVKEEGVVKLTLEAVAQRAGVSKGGLLYHYPSKEALIKSMVDDWINNYFESILTLANNDNKNSGKWIRAYVKATYADLDNKNFLSSSLMAAFCFYPNLLQEFRERYNNFLMNLIDDGVDPVKLTIARLTIDGLWFSEIFELAPLSEEIKTQIYNELINMLEEDE